MITTIEKCPSSSVRQMFYNRQSTRNGDGKILEGVILTSPQGTLVLIYSLLAATLYQEMVKENASHLIMRIILASFHSSLKGSV